MIIRIESHRIESHDSSQSFDMLFYMAVRPDRRTKSGYRITHQLRDWWCYSA